VAKAKEKTSGNINIIFIISYYLDLFLRLIDSIEKQTNN
jgi:hypothetical protein